MLYSPQIGDICLEVHNCLLLFFPLQGPGSVEEMSLFSLFRFMLSFPSWKLLWPFIKLVFILQRSTALKMCIQYWYSSYKQIH